jgi:hypothetical protein
MLINVLLMPMSEESLNRLKGSGAIRGAVLCTNPSENVFKAFAAFLTHVDERITVHPSNNEVWSVSVWCDSLLSQLTYNADFCSAFFTIITDAPRACPGHGPGLRGCAPARPDNLSVHLCTQHYPHPTATTAPRRACITLHTGDRVTVGCYRIWVGLLSGYVSY